MKSGTCRIPKIEEIFPPEVQPLPPGMLQMGKGKMRQHRPGEKGKRKGNDPFVKGIQKETGGNYEDTSGDLHKAKGGIDGNNDIDYDPHTGDFVGPGGDPLS